MQTKPRERALEHVEDFLYDLHDQPSGLARELFLLEHYSHLSRGFVNRHLGALMLMEPHQFVAVLGYPDITGEKATSNVLDERGF